MFVVYGVLVVCGACLAAVVGLMVVQRLVPVTIRKEYNDVAGFVYAVLGVIYAVLLALVVIATWEEFGRGSSSTRSGRPSRGTGLARWPARSSTPRGSTRSSGWPTTGGRDWWPP